MAETRSLIRGRGRDHAGERLTVIAAHLREREPVLIENALTARILVPDPTSTRRSTGARVSLVPRPPSLPSSCPRADQISRRQWHNRPRMARADRADRQVLARRGRLARRVGPHVGHAARQLDRDRVDRLISVLLLHRRPEGVAARLAPSKSTLLIFAPYGQAAATEIRRSTDLVRADARRVRHRGPTRRANRRARAST